MGRLPYFFFFFFLSWFSCINQHTANGLTITEYVWLPSGFFGLAQVIFIMIVIIAFLRVLSQCYWAWSNLRTNCPTPLYIYCVSCSTCLCYTFNGRFQKPEKCIVAVPKNACMMTEWSPSFQWPFGHTISKQAHKQHIMAEDGDAGTMRLA